MYKYNNKKEFQVNYFFEQVQVPHDFLHSPLFFELITLHKPKFAYNGQLSDESKHKSLQT